jgi:Protein of unknown function (DUF2934)
MATSQRSSRRSLRGLLPPGTPRAEHPSPSMAARHRAIAVAAYFRAERRGFAAGGELADWLAAERDVDQQMSGAAECPDQGRV